MPSEHSVYEKIKLVLQIAKSAEIRSVHELQSEILALGPTNFMTRRYDATTDGFRIEISDKSIKRTLSICKTLGLINEDGHLSESGRNATRKNRFDEVLASQVRDLLQRKGIILTSLNEVILDGLKIDPPIMPTAKHLWEVAGTSMQFGEFSRMLSLLAQCGGAKSAQKKLYLEIN